MSEFELLKKIDGYKSVWELKEMISGLNIHDIKRILSYYLTNGNFLEKIDLYPQILKINNDTRNELPKEYLAISYSLENICDGDISLSEISKKIDIPIKTLKKVLDLLGKEVTYRKKTVNKLFD